MRTVLDSTLNRIAQVDDSHIPAPEFGERTWLAKGRHYDVIYWDEGNGWCEIIKVILRPGNESWLGQFFDDIEASDDEESEL